MRNGGLALAVFAAALMLGLLGAGGRCWAQDAAPRGGGPEGELPRGGKSVFPQHRVVGFYGAPQSPQLGELGNRLARQRREAPGAAGASLQHTLGNKKLLPVFELLGTIALASPGADGKYRARQPDRIIRRYANEAREEKFLFMMDIQPGRSTFIEEARHLEPWLKRSFVSIALDPEWNMGPSGVPGERIGSVDASMVNKVTAYLSKLIRENDLPQKLVVIHQFTEDMVKNKENLPDPPQHRPRAERGRLRHSEREAVEIRAAGSIEELRHLPGVQALLRGGHEPDEPGPGDGARSRAEVHRLRVGPAPRLRRSCPLP